MLDFYICLLFICTGFNLLFRWFVTLYVVKHFKWAQVMNLTKFSHQNYEYVYGLNRAHYYCYYSPSGFTSNNKRLFFHRVSRHASSEVFFCNLMCILDTNPSLSLRQGFPWWHSSVRHNQKILSCPRDCLFYMEKTLWEIETNASFWLDLLTIYQFLYALMSIWIKCEATFCSVAFYSIGFFHRCEPDTCWPPRRITPREVAHISPYCIWVQHDLFH